MKTDCDLCHDRKGGSKVTMKKEYYEEPEMEVIEFENEDIVTDSPGTGTGTGGIKDPDWD